MAEKARDVCWCGLATTHPDSAPARVVVAAAHRWSHSDRLVDVALSRVSVFLWTNPGEGITGQPAAAVFLPLLRTYIKLPNCTGNR